MGGVVADGLLVGSDIDAVDLVVGDVAFEPLDAGKSADNAAGFLGNGVEVGGGEFAGSGEFAFDKIFGHVVYP